MIHNNPYASRFAGDRNRIAFIAQDGEVKTTGDMKAHEKVASWSTLEKIYYNGTFFMGIKNGGGFIHSDGWGWKPSQKYKAPDWTDLRSLSLNEDHMAGVTLKGSVLSTMFSVDWSEVEQVVVGGIMKGSHFIAGLRNDGRIIAEGHSDAKGLIELIGEWTSVACISAIHDGIAAIFEDGTARFACLSYSGQGKQTFSNAGECVLPWKQVNQIYGNVLGIYVLTNDGCIYEAPRKGQVNDEPALGSDYLAISNGIALKKSGEIESLSGLPLQFSEAKTLLVGV